MYLPRIRELRKEKGLKQKEVSGMLGLSQQAYSRCEVGNIESSLESLAILAKLYGVSVDYIIGMTDDRTPYAEKQSESEQ